MVLCPLTPLLLLCVCSVLNGWTKKAETVAGGGGESASICAPAAVFAVFVHSASAANVQWTNPFFLSFLGCRTVTVPYLGMFEMWCLRWRTNGLLAVSFSEVSLTVHLFSSMLTFFAFAIYVDVFCLLRQKRGEARLA